jgi:hypothetical protein
MTEIFAGDVIELPSIKDAIQDPAEVARLRREVLKGTIIVIKNVCAPPAIRRMTDYLKNVGGHSLPTYLPIKEQCPNFHRINVADERAYVQGTFHQFVFFPWNQDVFNLFEKFKDIYFLKNLLAGIPKERFIGRTPEAGCTARLAFQFYPSGIGELKKHSDPVAHHQLVAPTMLLSKKGSDFFAGGAFAERSDGSRVDLDEIAGAGSVVFFHAQIPHGVERIDPSSSVNWLSFQGRWMLLFAVNRLQDNPEIPDSREV